MRYWLMKSEPETWSWQQQVARGRKGEPWNGVRNYQANNFMKDMQCGDLAFFYHSVKEKQIVGIVEICREHYPDPSDESARFGMVDVRAVRAMTRPIALDEIKATKSLGEMKLLKQSRLSVQPVRKKEWDIILRLSEQPKK